MSRSGADLGGDVAHALSDDQGFSLIEVLVALTILALGAGALIEVGQTHVDRIRQIEARSVAGMLAQNQLVEMRLGLRPIGDQSVDQEMMGGTWRISVRSQPTSDPDLVRVDIAVSETGASVSSADLTGFVDVGASVPISGRQDGGAGSE